MAIQDGGGATLFSVSAGHAAARTARLAPGDQLAWKGAANGGGVHLLWSVRKP